MTSRATNRLGLADACRLRVRGWLAGVRRRLTPWDVDWEPHGDERRFDIPDAGRQGRGRSAEEAVARHLWFRGYKILARNCRNRYGEIDIVALGNGRLRFIEVRSYRDADSSPSSRLPRSKRWSIYRASEHYVSLRHEFRNASRLLELAEVRYNARGRVAKITFIPLDVTDIRRPGQ
jgi:putative endonuclease